VEGHSRRGLSGLFVCVALAATSARASVGPAEQSGVFALLGGTPRVVSKFWAEHRGGLTATLNVRQFQPDGKTPILNYDVDMQKLMHIVVVRDDFATFDHLHPAFDAASGTFSQPFTKVPNHRYYLYADSTPRGIGQQVFRFTIESDGPIAKLTLPATPSAAITAAGPYAVALERTTLEANRAQALRITILENGAPARDLTPYLGAAAHVVFINVSSLAYVHVHPAVIGTAPMATEGMTMNGRAGPLLQAELPPLPAGTYKAWIQFRGRDELYTAAFTLQAR